MKLFLITAMTGAMFLVPTAFGQRIEERKDNQKARIAEGKKSGELTPAEAAKLKARERNLKRTVRQDRRDGGGLTAAERAKIEARQDNLSKDIAKEKHDAQKTAPK